MYVERFEVFKNFGYDLRFYPKAMLKRKFLHKEDINLVNQIQLFFCNDLYSVLSQRQKMIKRDDKKN